eukprot:802246_1
MTKTSRPKHGLFNTVFILTLILCLETIVFVFSFQFPNTTIYQCVSPEVHGKHVPIANTSTSIRSLIEWSINPKQFCFGNFTSDVVLASLGDITSTRSVLPDLTQLSRLNKGYYALKHDYVYCEFTANTEIERSAVYSKAPILLNVLKLYKYAVWLDFDVVAHANSRSLDHLLRLFTANKSVHMILTTDVDKTPYEMVHLDAHFHVVTTDTVKQPPKSEPPYHLSINTGIHLYRSCDWCFHFIREWHSYFDKADDQQAMFWHYYHHPNAWNKHIKIVSWKTIELMGATELAKIINGTDQNIEDDHLWHIAGGKRTWKQKQYIMRDLILKHMDQDVLKQYHAYKNALSN